MNNRDFTDIGGVRLETGDLKFTGALRNYIVNRAVKLQENY